MAQLVQEKNLFVKLTFSLLVSSLVSSQTLTLAPTKMLTSPWIFSPWGRKTAMPRRRIGRSTTMSSWKAGCLATIILTFVFQVGKNWLPSSKYFHFCLCKVIRTTWSLKLLLSEVCEENLDTSLWWFPCGWETPRNEITGKQEEEEETFSAFAASKDPSLKAWGRLSSMMVNASLKLSVVVSLRKTLDKRLGNYLGLSPPWSVTFGLQLILPLRRRLWMISAHCWQTKPALLTLTGSPSSPRIFSNTSAGKSLRQAIPN